MKEYRDHNKALYNMLCTLGVEEEVVNSPWAGWSDGWSDGQRKHRNGFVKKGIQTQKVIGAKVNRYGTTRILGTY